MYLSNDGNILSKFELFGSFHSIKRIHQYVSIISKFKGDVRILNDDLIYCDIKYDERKENSLMSNIHEFFIVDKSNIIKKFHNTIIIDCVYFIGGSYDIIFNKF